MHNIAILGLGLNGLSVAYGLAKNEIHCTIFDENPSQTNFDSDARTAFISNKTIEFFSDISIKLIEKSGIIEYIYSFKNNTNSVIELQSNNMGYVVDNSTLKYELMEYIKNSPFVTIVSNYNVQEISPSNGTIIGGKPFETVICALGARSSIYKTLNVFQHKYEYKQTAFVCNIAHTMPHNNIAVELFGENYILAVLPKKNTHTSSVILNIENDSGIDTETLLAFLQNHKRIRHIGEITHIVENVMQYPLFASYCKAQHVESVFFIGDAFHSVHPVLGQGFNMSVKDIAKLCNHIKLSRTLGISPNVVLDCVAVNNIANHLKIGFATHFFAKAFITKNKGMQCVTNALIRAGSILPAKITSPLLQKIL